MDLKNECSPATISQLVYIYQSHHSPNFPCSLWSQSSSPSTRPWQPVISYAFKKMFIVEILLQLYNVENVI